jgi:nicotinamidase-related amidase
MKTALIIIDIQNDYFPGGRMELVGAEAAAQRAKEVLAYFRGRNLPIVHIQHITTRPGATFFIPGTDGIAIHPGVAPLPEETLFVKHFPNSFRETPLLEHLHGLGIERLVLAGMMTSMCVDATARAAFDLGFQNVLLHDAMATRDLAFGGATVPAAQVHGAFLAALGSVYGRVLGVAEFQAELAAEK